MPSYDLIFLDPPYDTITENLHYIRKGDQSDRPCKGSCPSSSYQEQAKGQGLENSARLVKQEKTNLHAHLRARS